MRIKTGYTNIQILINKISKQALKAEIFLVILLSRKYTGGYLLKTFNAGQTWQLINLHTPNKGRPTGMFFLNNKTGFISGEKLFRKTTDGGQTWSEVIGPVSENISDISFKNGNEGYATSDIIIGFGAINSTVIEFRY